MPDNPAPINDDPPIGMIAVERNRYFTGKFMTARDFSVEQDYELSRHRIHQRLFHGWGIVGGLHVVPFPDTDPQSECARRWVVVKPGIAVDAYGREIFLSQDVPYELPLPPDAPDPTAPTPVRPPFLLCIRYAEDGLEPVPSLIDDTPGVPNALTFNHLTEGYRLEVRRLDDPAIHPGCWRLPNDPKATCGCDDAKPPVEPGLKADAPCGRLIPLALIDQVPPAAGTTGLKPVLSIDETGRRQLPTPPRLTRICKFNWVHGGVHDLDDLRDPPPPPPQYEADAAEHQEHPHKHPHHPPHHHEPPHRLRIEFSRALRGPGAPADATGVNEHTFIVQYKDSEDNLAYFPWHPDHPPCYDHERRSAVYTIDPGFLRRFRLEESVVYVTLKCDFLADKHGHAVDGNHLLGRVPTGDGIPGGTFESWFRLVDCRKEQGR